MTLNKTILAATVTLLAIQAALLSIKPPAAVAGQIVGDAARGKALTSKWCVSCHLLDGPSGDDGAPPLRRVAAKGTETPDFLRHFLMSPHKPMPPLQLTNQDIEDIAAYLATVPEAPKVPR